MGMYDYLLPFQQHLLDQVDMALEEIQGGGTSQGILLIGASGRKRLASARSSGSPSPCEAKSSPVSGWRRAGL